MIPLIFPKVPQSSQTESLGFPRNTSSPVNPPRDPKKNPTGHQLQVQIFRDVVTLCIFQFGGHIGVSKNRGGKPPKMDGENNGKPYEQMDDLGGPPLFLETPIYPLLGGSGPRTWICGFSIHVVVVPKGHNPFHSWP